MKNKLSIIMFIVMLSGMFMSAQDQSDEGEKYSSPFKIEEEYFIGKAVAANLITTYGILDNKKIVDYVSSIGNTLSLASDQPSTFHGYTFIVLDTKKVVSYACPDGFILVSMGLLKTVQNEDELASALACEISHIVYNDPVFSVSVETVTKYNYLMKSRLSDDDDFESKINTVFDDTVKEILAAVEKGYDKETTIRSDAQAFSMLENANYSPSAFVSALEKLYKNDEYNNTHPDMQTRIDNLKDMLSKSGNKTKIDGKRTRRFKSTMK